jgi:hypothetical protein
MSRPQPMTRSRLLGTPPATRTNRMAVWSLTLAILTLGGIGSLAGIVLGMAARRQIEVTGERGAGTAAAAVLVGGLTLLLAIGYWLYLGTHTGGTT